jgi:hypothetical protein
LLSHGSIKQTISKAGGGKSTTLSGKNNTTKVVTNDEHDEYGEESKHADDENENDLEDS